MVFMEELEDTLAIGNTSPDWVAKRTMPAFYELFNAYVNYAFDNAEEEEDLNEPDWDTLEFEADKLEESKYPASFPEHEDKGCLGCD